MNPAMQIIPMPMMMGGMMNPMMPMPSMAMMGSQMKCTMTPTGMTCEMMPLGGAMKDMFMKCCEAMCSMMQMGMPMMINCAGMTMMCIADEGRKLNKWRIAIVRWRGPIRRPLFDQLYAVKVP